MTLRSERKSSPFWIIFMFFFAVLSSMVPFEDAPRDYGPHKTLYNRFIRWSRLGVFDLCLP
jgi:transposase